MSSIISIISFFILLLATFSYSVPIGKNYGNSTVNYRYTTSQPFVNQGAPVNIRLTSNNQTTNVSIIYPDQSSEGSNSNEVTTWGVTRSPRTSANATDSSEAEDLSEGSYEESSVPSSTQINQKRAFEESPFSSESESNEKRSAEESSFPSTNNINDKRTLKRTPQGTIVNKKPRSFVDNDLYTTLESSTEFNQRAIRPVTSAEEFESSTPFYSQNQWKMTTNAEPSSSVEAFGQYTGLLNTEQSSTSDYETTESPFQSSRLTKTVSIIPGKITETRIYGNSPNQYLQPVEQQQQQQLSQVQNQ